MRGEVRTMPKVESNAAIEALEKKKMNALLRFH